MKKHYVNWKPVTFKNIYGEDFEGEFPELVDHAYGGTLLTRILDMPKKNPIAFDDAIRLAGKKFSDMKVGTGPGENLWYIDNFVEWISEIGYHIELTGDEFEAFALPDKLA